MNALIATVQLTTFSKLCKYAINLNCMYFSVMFIRPKKLVYVFILINGYYFVLLDRP